MRLVLTYPLGGLASSASMRELNSVSSSGSSKQSPPSGEFGIKVMVKGFRPHVKFGPFVERLLVKLREDLPMRVTGGWSLERTDEGYSSTLAVRGEFGATTLHAVSDSPREAMTRTAEKLQLLLRSKAQESPWKN